MVARIASGYYYYFSTLVWLYLDAVEETLQGLLLAVAYNSGLESSFPCK